MVRRAFRDVKVFVNSEKNDLFSKTLDLSDLIGGKSRPLGHPLNLAVPVFFAEALWSRKLVAHGAAFLKELFCGIRGAAGKGGRQGRGAENGDEKDMFFHSWFLS